jgi:DNA-binding LacI/PurR family transcriptional regulator
MVQGFQLEARLHGRRVINLSTGTDYQKEAEILGRLAEFDVKGAVFNPLANTIEEELFFSRAIQLSKIPIVLTGTLAGSSCPTVLVDNFHAGYVMTQHLIDRGCRNIGFLANGSMCSYVRNRYQGYCWALKKAGITVSPAYVLLEEERRISFEDPLAAPIALSRRYVAGAGSGLEAVVCADDFLAAGLIQTALDEGIRIPEDLKIVGIGDMVPNPPGGITLTTYRIPYEDVGRESFRLLDSILNAKADSHNLARIMIDGHLVIRSSSG